MNIKKPKSARFHRSVLLLTTSLFSYSLLSSHVYARWAELDEADTEYVKAKTIIKLKKDGSATEETEYQLKILNESGRQALSTQIFRYNALHSKLKVLGAKTINNGEEVIVPKEKIEDKSLASDRTGLSEVHQVLVPFERVAVGSIVQFKTKTRHFNPTCKDFYAGYLTFEGKSLWRKYKLIIESELPFFFDINDPRTSLDVKENKEELKHTLKVKLKKPIFECLVDEPEYSYAEPAIYTSISYSTEKDYERIGKLQAESYQPILGVPLPKKLETIRNKASKIDDEIDRIDKVVAGLIKKITYLGSWNTIEGSALPRSLETIITSGYGDCKEYSACLAAILNQLGYQAKIASVHRGEDYLEEKNPLPRLDEFNHSIVKVIGPSGKTYWIDPTNNVSMAGGIFPDIADRRVLVLDSENPIYECISAINYKSARFNYEKTITIRDDGYVSTEGSFCFQGESAQDLTEKLTLQPPSLVKETFIKELCEGNEPLNATVTLPDFIKRKVKPLKGTFSYGERHIMTRTNYGDAFPLRYTWYMPYVMTSKNSEGALCVGYPQTIVKKIIFKNASAKDLDRLAFSIRTPWLNATRDLSVTEEGVVITEIIEQLKSIIPANDLKSEEFAKLKETLRTYCDGVALIFSELGVDQRE